MNKTITKWLAVLAGSLWLGTASATPVLWTLQDVIFTDLSTASGSFVYDADTNVFSSIDLSTSTGSFTSLRDGRSDFVFFLESRPADLSGLRALPVGFATALTNAGGTVDLVTGFGQFSGEGRCNGPTCGSVGFFRFFNSGQVTTNPITSTVGEPTTLALAMGGLLLLRRRVRRS